MKTKFNPFLRSALLMASATLACSLSAQAGTYYWDTDGSGMPGFGTASGTWGADAFWGTDSAGSGATANTSITVADDVHFGTDADGLAAGTITGSATAQGFLNMIFGSASGAILLSGGALNLDSSTGSTITVNNASDTISTVLQGSGGKLVKAGTGALVLSGTNTYSGTTSVNAGTLTIQAADRSTSAIDVTGALNLAATNVFTSGHRVALNAPITINAGGVCINSNNSVNRIGNINLNGGTLTATFSEANYGSFFIGQANGVDPTVTVGGSVASTINNTNNGNIKMWSNVNFNVADVTGDANPDLTVSAVLGNQTADQGNAAANLTKSGAGTMTLSGANTYTGATTINAGAMKLQNTYASSSFAIASGALLDLNVASGSRDGATTTFSGAGTLRKTGAGASLWGGGAATFALGSGSLIDVQEGSFTGGSNANEVWTNNKSDLNVASGAAFNTVEANVRVNKITGSGTIGTGYSGAGYANFTIGVDNGTCTFDGVIQNTYNNASFVGNLVKAGTGTITLTGNNTYKGTTTISGGTLKLSGNNTIGAVTINAGSLDISGGNSMFSGNLTNNVEGSAGLSITGGVVNVNQIYSSVTDGADFAIGAGAEVHAAGGVFYRSWRGASGMYLNGGTLYTANLVGNANTTWWLNDRAYIHFNGTKIVATAEQTNFIQLAGGANYGNENFAKLNATTTFDTAGYNIGIGVELRGTAGLTKEGAGTLTLSGTNTYGGATTIHGGVLAVSGSTAAGSLVAVGGASATGAPTLSGTGTVNGTVTINAASGGAEGTLNPGAIGVIGTLTAGAAFINGTLAIDIDAASSDQLVVNGSLDLSGATLSLNELAVPAATPYTIATYTGTLTGTFASVPSGYTVNYGSGTNSSITLTKSNGISDYDTWGATYGLATGSEGDDLDGDGLTNFQEYAFGLAPNDSSSCNPILVTLSKSAGSFSYQRRKLSLTGLTSYKILTSTDLVTWTEDVTASQDATEISTANESVVVTLTTPPTTAKFFVRVSAQ